MDLDVVVTLGLGNNSYLLASGGEAVLVDPQRDVGRLLAGAERRGVRVRHVLETHVHNDYVSGALETRAATGAAIAGPAEAGYAFPFTPMEEGAELRVGDLRLEALSTPGHTPEHTSYLLHERGISEPVAVFSGGSLIVGSAGRTDLLGAELAPDLARSQFGSLRRLAEMPDAAALLPTHGAGSFCASGPPQDDRTSTIGSERASNPALRAPDVDTFLHEQLEGLNAFPAYYAHMAPINRSGPVVLGGVPEPATCTVEEAEGRIRAGARLVDTRAGAAFAAAHVPGSLNVPLEDSFASYVGWLVPFPTPLVLVVDGADALAEATTHLFRIGWDAPVVALNGGIDAWVEAGRSVGSYPLATLEDLLDDVRDPDVTVLDVRQRTEWDAGHLEGSLHCFVPDVPARVAELVAAGPVTVACASGYRSAMAASLLRGAGVEVRLVAEAGVPKALRRLR